MTNRSVRRATGTSRWKEIARPLAVGSSLGIASAVIPAPPAAAHGFAVNSVGDNQLHTWISTETTQGDLDIMQPYVDDRMVNQWDARTQLESQKLTTYSDNVDFYWFVTNAAPPGAADAACVEFWGTGVNGIPRCNRTRIRFNRDWMLANSADQKRQGACHEIGHSLGFDDSVPENHVGCMSGGPNGTLSTHEINHIDAFYDPY